MIHSGRHFLQIPGPTNVPDRVLRAMDRPVIDHRGPEFAALTIEVLNGLKRVFRTTGRVALYPASGTGVSEAALVNTLSPGDRVLIFETGHFSDGWRRIAEHLGLQVEYVPGNWRRGASDADAEARLAADRSHAIKAVVVVHNETSTGVTSRIGDLRRAIDRADVTVCGSQKGLMLPPGLGLLAVSEKALEASTRAALPRHYWDWQDVFKQNESGFFPYTPPTNLIFGLREALAMLDEEGLPNVLRRHDRHAEATRAAVRAWGLEIVCEDPREHSSSLTAVFMPDGFDSDELRRAILDHFDLSLGTGLGRYAGRVFRIGHLGSFNDLMLAGTLSGIEMGLRLAGVPHRDNGVAAALQSLTGSIRLVGGRALVQEARSSR
jgi:alanine-glyoxylate transaminase/serine-glyoxylate transaminase/serine-pyruvate transaminase